LKIKEEHKKHKKSDQFSIPNSQFSSERNAEPEQGHSLRIRIEN